jgi:phosphatidylserine/phosphatidylglycerophosphate/cardiolipin synthase-like enzyme
MNQGRVPGTRRLPARGLSLRSTIAVVAAIAVLPAGAAASFFLPTGPSEKEDTVAIVPAPLKSFPGAIPAGVKILADRDFQATLESEIAAARSEITVCAYLFAAKDGPGDRPGAIASRLAEAASRGVKVDVILEIGRESAAVTQANREAARMLGRRGVKVFVDGSGTTVHARFVVVDRRLVFIGSHDLTESSLGEHREVSLLVDSMVMASVLLEQVESFKPIPYAEPPSRRPPKRAVRSRPPRTR